jgi:uncharacterized phage-like protein YoqJ
MQQLGFPTTEYKACAITGHRILHKEFSRKRLTEALRDLILQGVEDFYNGLALGFDLITAETLVALRKEYPQIRIHGCIPFYGQENRFPAEDKERYVRLVKECDDTVVLSEDYTRDCYFKRNDYMVEHADVLFAYCHSKKGGAAYTVRVFTRKKGGENILFFE